MQGQLGRFLAKVQFSKKSPRSRRSICGLRAIIARFTLFQRETGPCHGSIDANLGYCFARPGEIGATAGHDLPQLRLNHRVMAEIRRP